MDIPIIMLFVVLVVCFIIRMPVSFSMLAASVTCYLLAAPDKVGQILTVITENMFFNYTMPATPLFIFMANVLNEGETTDKLFSFCNDLLGCLKGGTAQINVSVSPVFPGITGSAIADVSDIGLMETEQMRKEGYDLEFNRAITAASTTTEPIFPPSVPMVTYAILSGASVGKLFMGGMVPGVLLAALLMVYAAYISHKRSYPAGAVTALRQFGKATITVFPVLLTVILLLGGIYTGAYISTEAGAIASAYALFISPLIYRVLGLKKLIGIIREFAVNIVALAFSCGISMLFSYVISLEQTPAAVATAVIGITDNRYILLLVVNIVFLLLGCMLDVNTIQLVFVLMVLPLVKAFGIDLVHFGVVICLNMMVGLSTPPSDMLLFIVAGLGETRIAGVMGKIPSMVLTMTGLLFPVTYVSDIMLFIPNIFI